MHTCKYALCICVLACLHIIPETIVNENYRGYILNLTYPRHALFTHIMLNVLDDDKEKDFCNFLLC